MFVRRSEDNTRRIYPTMSSLYVWSQRARDVVEDWFACVVPGYTFYNYCLRLDREGGSHCCD